MKFKLLAISAAVLASTGAQAQSSVTLYGIADVGVEYLTKPTSGGSSVMQMQSGNLSGSRWGLRGAEDLGGGLKAVFTLESGFNIDTGAAASKDRLFNRQSFAGLQGNFGTLTLGRHQTQLFDFSVAYDPMGLGRYSIYTMDKGMGSRADNSLKYSGNFGGLTASALYSFGYDTVNGIGEKAGDSKLGREYAASLGYAAGPFSVGGVYDFYQPETAHDTKIQRASLAGTYAFGPAKVYAGYRWLQSSVTGDSVASSLYWAGLGYKVAPALTLTGAAYYQNMKQLSNAKTNPWLFVALADYALSKRTDVYLQAAYAMNQADNGLASTLTLDGFTGKTFASGEKTNQFGTMVGIRHRF